LYTRRDLEPISFDDLPLGGEWTTRRRTISESDISLFAGVAGDFSPLTIETRPGGARVAPPALLVAMAIGLGSMDMPVPSVAEWDWLNWKFPRPVHAGETIYARWILTQKRPPVGGTPTSIVVWRVDVHTSDGVLCAEGEVGASVIRKAGAKAPRRDQEAATSSSTAVSRRRRRRRATGGNGQKAASDGTGPVVETPAIAAPLASAATPDRALGPARRRRRRRSPPNASGGDKNSAPPAQAPTAEPAPPREAPAPVTASAATPASPLSRVIRRLRRT
jgi:acyl dehydratase